MTHRDTHRLGTLASNMRRDANLMERLSGDHEHGQRHLADELSVLGWPRRGDSVCVSGGGDGLTSVERDADICYALTAIREDVRDQVDATLSAYNNYLDHVKALGMLLHTARRTGLSKAERERMKLEQVKPAVCADHQHGKHGVDEWGDALCFLPSVKAGLCQQHYDAWRWRRRRDGISTDGDYAPVA